jgi:hypothetical protein
MTDQPTRTELFVEFVQRRFLSLVFVTLAGLLLVSMFGLSVPTEATVALLSMLGAAPVGYFAFGRIRTQLPTPPMVYLVDVELLQDDDAGLWRIPESNWGDLDVTDGSLWNPAPSLYFGKGYDAEEMTVRGTWRGSLSDGEMLRALSLVKEVRGDLEKRAKRGERIRNNAFTLIRGATQGEVERIVETFEEGTLPSGGEEFESHIEDVLSDFDLDEPATDGLNLDDNGDGPDGDRDDGHAEQAGQSTSNAAAADLDQEVPAGD